MRLPILALLVAASTLAVSSVHAAPTLPTDAHVTEALARLSINDAHTYLRAKLVRQELNLTATQEQKIDELSKALRGEQIRAASDRMRKDGDVPDAEYLAGRLTQMRDFQRKFNSDLQAQLQPEQLRRLKQLVLQSQSPRVLLDYRVLRALRLSVDQEDQLNDLLTKEEDRFLDERRLSGDFPDKDFIVKRAESKAKGWAAAMRLLTAEQQATLDKLTGKRLSLKEIDLAIQPYDARPAGTPPAPPPPPPPPVKD